MEQQEIKFQFIVDGKFLTQAYAIEDLLNIDEEKILENMEACTCQKTESNNHCECEPQFADSKITARRQFTGNTDRNNKEIFEGDVLICFANSKESGTLEIAEFKNGAFILRHRCINIYEWENGSDGRQLEIIGNIYEHPSLNNQQ